MNKNVILNELVEWLGVIFTSLIIAMFINFCIIVNAKVPSGSMENTIMTGDRVIGFRLSYAFDEPQRGDIVIFKYPDDESILYIKRIIGMPGDHIMVKEGSVFVNGEVLDEPYLDVVTNGTFGPYDVPEDSYFMMGDNRNMSADSRVWDNTYVHKDKILGKAIFKYYPNIESLIGE